MPINIYGPTHNGIIKPENRAAADTFISAPDGHWSARTLNTDDAHAKHTHAHARALCRLLFVRTLEPFLVLLSGAAHVAIMGPRARPLSRITLTSLFVVRLSGGKCASDVKSDYTEGFETEGEAVFDWPRGWRWHPFRVSDLPGFQLLVLFVFFF